MGMVMSFMGKGIPSTQALNFFMGTIQRQFVDKNINNFDEFHRAILDIFNSCNSALPGRHYDVPSTEQVKACYDEWIRAPEDLKKEVFVSLMKKNISINRLDNSAMIVGMAAPPAAMAAKRAAENAQMKVIKVIPDVIFVPSLTVLALVSAKLTRRMLQSRANGGGAGGNMPEEAPRPKERAPMGMPEEAPRPKERAPMDSQEEAPLPKERAPMGSQEEAPRPQEWAPMGSQKGLDKGEHMELPMKGW